MGPRVALPPNHVLPQKQRGNLSLKALPGRPGPTVEAELCAFPLFWGGLLPQPYYRIFTWMAASRWNATLC